MIRFRDLVEFFWPWLEKHTPEEEAAIVQRAQTDEARIAALSLTRAPNIALDEVRRLADSEAERRRGTEQKAATYLPLVAALIPLVLTVVSALWEKKAGGAPIWLNMLLLGLAVAYTAAAGWWAFKALKVAISYEPGLGDFEKAWGSPHPSATLAARLLALARQNQEGINWKVSCIMMAHQFLLRAFLTFSLLLIVNIFWYLVGLLIQLFTPLPGPKLATPQQALTAVARIDSLAGRMGSAPAWNVLAEDCRTRTNGREAVRVVSKRPSPAATSPRVLKPEKGETVMMHDLEIRCGGRILARVRAWYVQNRLAGLQQETSLAMPLASSGRTAVTGIQQNWPLKTLSSIDATRLPTVLIRQFAAVLGTDGRVAATFVVDVGPDTVDHE